MTDLKRSDANTMTLDVLLQLSAEGDKVACPVCGEALQISVEPRRMAFCAVDRKHSFVMPSTLEDRIELDALFKNCDWESSREGRMVRPNFTTYRRLKQFCGDLAVSLWKAP